MQVDDLKLLINHYLIWTALFSLWVYSSCFLTPYPFDDSWTSPVPRKLKWCIARKVQLLWKGRDKAETKYHALFRAFKIWTN